MSARSKELFIESLWLFCLLILPLASAIMYANSMRSSVILAFGDSRYFLEVADTDATRTHGLGGRSGMGLTQGMLFKFDTASQQCFWMKDMHFPLDIMWVDSQKKVVHVVEHVSPNTYPESFCADNTQYVIELNAGEVKRAGIGAGHTLSF